MNKSRNKCRVSIVLNMEKRTYQSRYIINSDDYYVISVTIKIYFLKNIL